MSYETLEIERTPGIAAVWMNRPERHNAFDETLIRELRHAVEQLSADDGARVIVLGGRGKSFSAGADLNWMRRAAGYGVDENLRDARALAAMLRAIDRTPKPTIARIHGAALGGGMGLACACDIAIAASEASFATTEVRFGIIPATIGPYVVRAMGARMASRYFLTGERLSAQEAHRVGVVHEVCSADALDETLRSVTQNVLRGGPRAQSAAKTLLRQLAGRTIDEAVIDETAHAIADLRVTPEAKEGIAAFLDKREASWRAT